MGRYARYLLAIAVLEFKGRYAVCECNAAKCVGAAERVVTGLGGYFCVIMIFKQRYREVELLRLIRPFA